MVAPRLLGAELCSHGPTGVVVVRLTEVEAYGGGSDPGSHAFRGQTRRNASMFGPPGHAYVYFTYGMHWCLNIVTGPVGCPGAILIRAGEVIVGGDIVAARRPGARPRDVARGPARLTKALAVTGDLDGTDLTAQAGPLFLRRGAEVGAERVGTGPRVGVSGAGARTPWRFFLRDEPTVSVYRPGRTG